MENADRLQELLLHWEEAKENGREISAHDLCNDCPELLPELQQRIKALRSIEDWLGENEVGAESVDDPERTTSFEVDSAKITPASERAPARLPEHAGKYRIVNEIARGGMGVVWRVHDPDFKRTLALKVLLNKGRESAEAERRFLAEAEITGQLQHPGIPPVHELGRLDDGRPFFAMKLIEGRTLAALLKSRDQESGVRSQGSGAKKPTDGVRWDHRDLPRFIHIFEQICQTIAYAHSRGIIHRDLKPLNVMVGEFGEVQVMDWGLAKVVRGPSSVVSGSEGTAVESVTKPVNADDSVEFQEPRTTDQELSTKNQEPRTRAGTVMGTPAYMAPEQARGEIEKLDARCDVFGLGAILCEMLTGAPAFEGASGMDLLRQAADGDLTRAFERLEASGADAALIEIAKSCLAPIKEDRLPNAGAVAAAVEKYQAQVQERLRQAEIQKREAQVKTEEERKRRQVEQAKVAAEQAKSREERRRRRVQLVLGLVVFVMLLSGGGVVLWYMDYLNRKALDQQEKQFRGQQDATQLKDVLDKIQQTHDQFEAALHQKGGVFQLQNKRKEWSEKIDEALQTLSKRGTQLLARVQGSQNQKLGKRMGDLQKQLQDAQWDWKIAAELGYIRERRMVWVGDSIDSDYAREHYPKAFDQAKVNIHRSPEKVAKQIRSLRIKEQLIASLDDWALVTYYFELDAKASKDNAEKQKQFKLRSRLLQIAKLADNNRWAYRLRSANEWYKLVRDQKALMQIIKRLPPKTSPQLFVVLGRLCTDKSPAQAVWLRLASSRYEHDFTVNFSTAYVLENSPAEANGYLRAAVTINPRSSAAYTNWGASLLRQNYYTEAIRKFKKAITIDSKHVHAYNNWGFALFKQKRYPEAISKFKKTISLKQIGHAYYNWGIALTAQKQYAQAVTKFHQAKKLKPRLAGHSNAESMAFNEWSKVLFQQKRYTEAESNFNLAITLISKLSHERDYFYWGDVFFSRKRYTEAIAKFEKATLTDSNYVEAYVRWGDALAKLKRYNEAIAKYQKAIDIKPENANVYDNWGLVLNDQKKYVEAIAKFRRAIVLDPNSAEAYLNWGIALHEQKQYTEAIGKFEEAIKIAPKSAKAYQNWGSSLYAQKQYTKAIAKYKKALEFDPHDAGTYRMSGNALQYQKRFSEATAKYQKALEIDPKDSKTIHDWGTCLANQKRYTEAFAKFQKAIRIAPKLEIASVYYTWGSILAFNQRQYTDAIAKFRMASKINPHFADAYSKWAYALMRLNRYDEAIAKCRQAIKIDPKNERAYRYWGYSLTQQKKYSEAITPLKNSIHLRPESPNAHYGLAMALMEQGMFRDAITSFRVVTKLTSANDPLHNSSLREIEECKHYLKLDKKLPDVISGKVNVDVNEQLEMAYMLAFRYNKQYQDAVTLFARVFRKQPRLAQDIIRHRHRYNAARAAILAAAGQGRSAKKIKSEERTTLRNQALAWLQADLQTYNKLLQKSALVASIVQARLKRWQEDADIGSVRGPEAVGILPQMEQKAWQKLWSEVAALRKQSNASYTETILKGNLTNTKLEQVHEIKLTAGKSYIIDMQSKEFDTFLRLHDAKGKLLAKNDDIDYQRKLLNSRIVVTPKQDGTYHIIATSYQQRGRGAYTLRIFAFKNDNAK